MLSAMTEEEHLSRLPEENTSDQSSERRVDLARFRPRGDVQSRELF